MNRLLIAALLVGSTFALEVQAQPNTPDRIKEIVASPDRTPADLTNDKRRHPEDILGFLAITPGITALDLSAGGGDRKSTRLNSSH